MATFILRKSLGNSALRSSVAGGAPGDTLRYSVVLNATSSDTLTLTDTVARKNILARPISEASTWTDTQTRTTAPKRTGAETLTEADTNTRVVARSRTGTDILTTVESIVRRNTLARALAEATSLADALTDTYSPKRSIADTLSEIEALVRSVVDNRSPADTETLTNNNATRVDTLTRTATESTSWSDSFTRSTSPHRTISDLWTTGAAVIQRLAPDFIRFMVHLSGTVADIQDDPDSPSGSQLVDDGNLGEVRVSFPQPPGGLTTGAGLQEFRIKITP